MRTSIILAAGVVGVAAYVASRRQADEVSYEPDVSEPESDGFDSVLSDAATTAMEFIDSASGGLVKVSAMRTVAPGVLGDLNVQAMLRVIRAGEGTADDGGYRRLFGGGTFESLADHPRIVVSKSGYRTTAAGAYQMLSSTWDETKAAMGLRDFSPASQDLAAVGRIAARGALADVIAGRFDKAVKKLGGEWASLPGSPYGQPTISIDRARSIYAMSGGAFSETQTA